MLSVAVGKKLKKSENNKVHVFISDWSVFNLTGMYVIDLLFLLL